MASYALREHVREALQRVPSSVDGNASSVSDNRIDRELAGATAEIDAKLASHYTTPFDPVPELIRWICEAIAAHRSDLTFRETRDLATDLNPVYLRYQQAEGYLAQLQTGEMVIPPVGSTPDPGSGMRVAEAITRTTLIDPCAFDIDSMRMCPVDYTTPEGWAIH